MEHLSERTFKTILNGGADQAVMTDLFGLEHASSKGAHSKRQKIAMLEGLVLTDQATSEEKKQYEEMKRELPDDIAELASRRLQAVLGGTGR
jgi:hypothetical protein